MLLSGLLRTECFRVFQNGSFSLSPVGSRGRIFSDVYCENLVKILEVNLTILLRIQQFLNYISDFPPLVLVHRDFSCEPGLPVFACLLLQFWYSDLARVLHFYRSKWNCGFFSLFSFLLVARMKWQLPSTLYIESKTRSHSEHFKFILSTFLKKKKKNSLFKVFLPSYVTSNII